MSFAKRESPEEIAQRGARPEDVGLSAEEYEKRKQEALQPLKVQKAGGMLTVKSSSRAQQILSRGVLDNFKQQRATKKDEFTQSVFRAKFVGTALSLFLGCGCLYLVLLPMMQLHLRRGQKRELRQQSRQPPDAS